MDGYSSGALVAAAKGGDLPSVQSYVVAGAPLQVLHDLGAEAAAGAAAGDDDSNSVLKMVQMMEESYATRDTRPTPTEFGKDRTAALLAAAGSGHDHVVAWLIDSAGAGVNDAAGNGTTALVHAASAGHLDVVKWLVDSMGAQVDKACFDGTTAVVAASAAGHLDIVEWLVESADASVGDVPRGDKCALSSAVNHGHTDIVRYLVETSGIDLSHESKGIAHMVRAASRGYVDTVRLLAGVVGLADTGNTDPLFAAVRAGCVAVVQCLVQEFGLDVNAVKGRRREMALAIAAGRGDLVMVTWLVNKGSADLSSPAPILCAAASGHLNVVQWFITEKGVDVDIRGPDGHTPLLSAVTKDRVNVAQWLVANGASVNVCTSTSAHRGGGTALHLAIKKLRGDDALVRWLVSESHADPNITDVAGVTPLLLAIREHKSFDFINWLVCEGRADVNKADAKGDVPLLAALRSNKIDVVRLLVDRGSADINAVNNRGVSPLILAARQDKHKVADMLLDLGADATAIAVDGQGPLHFAAAKGRLVCANGWSVSPLHLAAEVGHMKVVRELVGRGADLHKPRSNGFSPIFDAVAAGHIAIATWMVCESLARGGTALSRETVSYVVDRGIDLLAPDEDGRRAPALAWRADSAALATPLVNSIDFPAQGRVAVDPSRNDSINRATAVLVTCIHAALASSNAEPLTPTRITELVKCGAQLDDIIDGRDYSFFDETTLLGASLFGRVHPGIFHGTQVAVKALPGFITDDDIADVFKAEVTVLGKLRHPNILLFIATCLDLTRPLIVTEYMERGTLTELLADDQVSLSMSTKISLAADVARGMAYLHGICPPIVHRDLKSPNVLVSGTGERLLAKVSDFGFSRSLSSASVMATTTGSPRWMAPEVILSATAEGYSHKVDVYSFGIVLWEILARQLPYPETPVGANELAVAVAAATQGKRPSLDAIDAPLAIVDLVTRCWDVDPAARPEFSDILTVLAVTLDALPPIKRWDVFICHGGGDKGAARELYDNLIARELRVFLDVHSLDGERCECPDDLAAQVRASRVVVVLVSKFMLVSRWAVAEARAALEAADSGHVVIFPAFIGQDVTLETLAHYGEVKTDDPHHPLLSLMDTFFHAPHQQTLHDTWRHSDLDAEKKAHHVAVAYDLKRYGLATYDYQTISPTRALVNIADRVFNLADSPQASSS
ncbi:TKL protein kinase [Thecamonas trahens ATCC 50062]|uniref:TKL protein kinase n=1 Tax=Thecamonas trahens ATCC 50062 TaxID=461836 RepID=A0A0L0D1A3_THETB|nr:TKL protein kinase [Thecamonas trahens ATCC 50062]KNC45910.1 TKL protein kinase [Thecamonas trahens ATCC 50062]|eukprot:XP_013762898.1 TKL protein kinase [Thecamonas trahens ATCC 50062]